jgi:phenylacetate-CoA ligase
MLVTVESRGGTDPVQLAALLRQGLGVEVSVSLVDVGGTAADTQIDLRQKPIRLIDERKL